MELAENIIQIMAIFASGTIYATSNNKWMRRFALFVVIIELLTTILEGC